MWEEVVSHRRSKWKKCLSVALAPPLFLDNDGVVLRTLMQSLKVCILPAFVGLETATLETHHCRRRIACTQLLHGQSHSAY